MSKNENNNSEKDKKEKIIEKLATLKNEYLNNPECQNNELLIELESYKNLIQNIHIDLNIENIQSFLNSLNDLSFSLNNDISKNFEEKNIFYKEYNQFINSINDKLYNLERTKNDIIKNKIKFIELKNKLQQNKEIISSIDINNINSIEDCIANPLFIKYVDKDIYNRIIKINELFHIFEKYYEANKQNINDIFNLNKEFVNELKKYNSLYKNIKNINYCNKYMKNTGNNVNKINDYIINIYIKTFCDYFSKLSQIIIQKLSEENLKLEKGKFNKEQKEEKKENDINSVTDNSNQIKINNNIQNNEQDLNLIIDEAFKYVIGKTVNVENDIINEKVINLDDEFDSEENIIEKNNNINKDTNNDIFKEGERKNHYQNLFNLNQKLSELNKDNNDIIANLKKIENEFNTGKKELYEREKLLNDKYTQIIKNRNKKSEDLLKEKKYLEFELNNLKLEEQELELKTNELILKFKKSLPKNNNIFSFKQEKKNEVINLIVNDKTDEKKKDISINNNEIKEKKEKEIIENIDEKQKIIVKENKKEINILIPKEKNTEEIKDKINKSKNFFFFEGTIPFKKKTKSQEENINTNLNNENNNNAINQENYIINNNPFSLDKNKENEKVKENEEIVKQIRALDNLASVLSNRHNNSNQIKESSSPTIFKRGLNNDKNLSILFSGLSVNKSITSMFQVEDKTKSKKKIEIKEDKIENPFTNKINITKKNEQKSNFFDFDSKPNSNNPFNLNNNQKINPFNIQINNLNNNILNNNINNNNLNNNNNQQNIFTNQNSIYNIFQDLNLSSYNKKQHTEFNTCLFGLNKQLSNNSGNLSHNNNSIRLILGNNSNNNRNGGNINNNNNNNEISSSSFCIFKSNEVENSFINGTQNNNDEKYNYF